MQQRSFLIVGQGLAGSLLAWELLQRDCKLLVVDPGLSNASQVAAGLINPITGMRLVKTPKIDQLLPTALRCYQNLQQHFKQTFFVPKSMLRILRNAKETEYAKKRLQQVEYQPYLHGLNTDALELRIHASNGLLSQQQTGILQTKNLLNSIKSHLIEQQSYLQAQIDYQDFSFNQHRIRWQNYEFLSVIFCEGYLNCNNPWFSWLPMQPAKGELLTLQSDTIFPDKIINFGQWLIPTQAHEFRLGATFDRKNIDCATTMAGKAFLLETLKTIMPDFQYQQITAHQVGVRACTLDKMPFIGRHPQKPQVTLFNGFGSKGSLLIPWHAKKFADFLLYRLPLDEQVDLMRYFAGFFPN